MVPLYKCLHRNEQVWRVICTNVFREPTGIQLVSTGQSRKLKMLGGTFTGSMDREMVADCWNRSVTNNPCAAHSDGGGKKRKKG